VTIRFALNVSWDAVRIILAGGAFADPFFNIRLIYLVIAEIAVSLLFIVYIARNSRKWDHWRGSRFPASRIRSLSGRAWRAWRLF
jgi:hypothetical protein